MSRATIYVADVMDRLPELEAESFDAVLCDPPYGISFMGREWDHGVPGAEVWVEVLRVLKPGAPLLAFGGTRTYHRLACAIEDAGAQISDSILCAAWVHGQGFSKGINVQKSLRAMRRGWPGKALSNERMLDPLGERLSIFLAERASEGYNSAIKPAWEPVVCAWKPRAGTYAENALEHGVGGWNVDGGRVGNPARTTWRSPGGQHGILSPISGQGLVEGNPLGRYPSNLVLSHHPECRRVGERKVAGITGGEGIRATAFGLLNDDSWQPKTTKRVGYADPDGTETIPAYACHEDCPVAALDRASGENASRFYFQAEWGGADFLQYHAKASTAERNIGLPPCERCPHPTIKPVSLLAYLAKLIMPPERENRPRRLLVPFAGAGSEMMAALRAGWEEVVGIELEEEHARWAESRVRGDAPLLNQVELILHP